MERMACKAKRMDTGLALNLNAKLAGPRVDWGTFEACLDGSTGSCPAARESPTFVGVLQVLSAAMWEMQFTEIQETGAGLRLAKKTSGGDPRASSGSFAAASVF